MLKCLLHCRPGVTEESGVSLTCEDVILVDHQHELAVQIFPVVCVLPTESIRQHERIFLRDPEIVRHRAFRLSQPKLQCSSLLCLPDPRVLFRLILRHRICKLPHDLLIQIRPKFSQRHVAVKKNVERRVKGIIEALHERKRVRSFGRRAYTPAPEGTAIGKYVEFVEQLAPIPQGFRVIFYIRRLPGIDLVAPFICIGQRLFCDLQCIRPGGAVEIRVVPVPFTPAAELGHWHVPGDGHWNNAFLSGLKSETHRDGCREVFSATHP